MELGIDQLEEEDLKYMTRIMYRAEDKGGTWGEHEIDWVVVAMKDVEMKVNENEVRETRFVGREELRDLFASKNGGEVEITPWFEGIVKGFVRLWWPALLKGGLGEVEKMAEPEKIYRLR